MRNTFFCPRKNSDMRGYKPVGAGHPKQIAKLAEAINKAERPLLYVGGGVIAGNAAAELTALARKAKVPVTTTLMGLGAFPETDPLARELNELTIAAGRETDPEKRKEMYKRAEQILNHDLAAIAPLYHEVTYGLVKPYLHPDRLLMCGANWAEWTMDPH